MHRVYFRGNRNIAREAIIGVVRAVSGTPNQHLHLAKSVHTAVGVAALTDVKEDFIRKARGGTGEDGVQWPPLDPKTLAYSRRFGPGEQTKLKAAAGLGRANSYAPGGNKGLLTKAQLKRWRAIFAAVFARLMATDGDEGSAKARAAQIAWAVLKREGAKTKLEVFGHRKVEVLRDTSVLLNSLSPGATAGDRYDPPEGQIFRLTGSGVIVGTNVPYASVHQRGSKRGVPARPFLPVGKAPQVWVSRWSKAANLATIKAIESALSGVA